MHTKEFIEKSVAVHGEKYDYSLADYGKDGRSERTTIICKKHGAFTQRPKNHLAGRGCNTCTVEANSSALAEKAAATFVERAKLVHGDRYNYSETVYTKSQEKVEIICSKHGAFFITPNNHLLGKGCRRCMNLMTKEEFLDKAKHVHGDTYDYALVTISESGSKVKIICSFHGVFEQRYAQHLQGNGCPACSKTGYDTTKSGTLYVLELGDITKIGITNRDVSKRINQIKVNSGKKFSVVTQFDFEDGKIPLTLETNLLRELRKTYEQPSEKYDGSTESFINVDVAKLLDRIRELSKEFTT